MNVILEATSAWPKIPQGHTHTHTHTLTYTHICIGVICRLRYHRFQHNRYCLGLLDCWLAANVILSTQPGNQSLRTQWQVLRYYACCRPMFTLRYYCLSHNFVAVSALATSHQYTCTVFNLVTEAKNRKGPPCRFTLWAEILQLCGLKRAQFYPQLNFVIVPSF